MPLSARSTDCKNAVMISSEFVLPELLHKKVKKVKITTPIKKILLLAIFLSGAIICYVRFLKPEHPASRQSWQSWQLKRNKGGLPVLGKVADFSLTNHHSGSFRPDSLRGKIWLLSFTFTRCKGPCPMMNQKMAKLQHDLANLTEFHQVSISMDPGHDSPETLREYGRRFGAKDSRWTFLTGNKDHIISIAKNIFKLPAGEDPNTHSTRFVLIDRHGQIRGYFDSLQPEAIEKLKNEILLLHGQIGPPSS